VMNNIATDSIAAKGFPYMADHITAIAKGVSVRILGTSRLRQSKTEQVISQVEKSNAIASVIFKNIVLSL